MLFSWRQKAILLSLICSAVALIKSEALAQDNAPLQTTPFSQVNNSAPPRVVQGGAFTSGFSLDYFLQLVENNYPKLQSAFTEKRIASAKRLEKAGAFDPVLSSVNEYLRVQDTFTPGKAKDAVHNESRIDLLTRSGIKVFTGMRLNPNDTKTPFVPSGSAGEYYAGLTVPILRGRVVNEKVAAEDQAKLGEPLAEQLFGATRLEVLLKAAAVYWDWVGAKARIDIAQNLLKIAETRVDQIKERVAKGDLPALDISESEQETQRRRAALIKSEREFQKASFQLSVFLWDSNGSPSMIPGINEVPQLTPEPRKLSEVERIGGRKVAIAQRPELKRIAIEREQAKIELRLAENMKLPAMDAYLLQGADTGQNGIGPVVRAGMSVNFPLRQRTARGQAEAARLKIQKLNFDESVEKLRIQAEVDDAVSAMNTSCDRWNATLTEVKKAQQVEEGERQRFSAGDGNLFLVNLRERATAEAKMRLAEVHIDYLQAQAAFRAVTCSL